MQGVAATVATARRAEGRADAADAAARAAALATMVVRAATAATVAAARAVAVGERRVVAMGEVQKGEVLARTVGGAVRGAVGAVGMRVEEVVAKPRAEVPRAARTRPPSAH